MCRKHYSRWCRHGDTGRGYPEPEERFWPHVAKGPRCWTWTRFCNPAGYGKLVYPGGTLAHRFSWILANGEIPDGLDVLHKCDNPPCVRPDHLFLGTDADNAADKVAKGRSCTYSGRRQKLDWESVGQIRAAVQAGQRLKMVASRFDVSVATVWNISQFRTWDPAKKRP